MKFHLSSLLPSFPFFLVQYWQSYVSIEGRVVSKISFVSRFTWALFQSRYILSLIPNTRIKFENPLIYVVESVNSGYLAMSTLTHIGIIFQPISVQVVKFSREQINHIWKYSLVLFYQSGLFNERKHA